MSAPSSPLAVLPLGSRPPPGRGVAALLAVALLLAGGAGSTGGDGRSAGFVHLLDGQSGRGRDVARRYSLVDVLVDDDGPADYV